MNECEPYASMKEFWLTSVLRLPRHCGISDHQLLDNKLIYHIV